MLGLYFKTSCDSPWLWLRTSLMMWKPLHFSGAFRGSGAYALLSAGTLQRLSEQVRENPGCLFGWNLRIVHLHSSPLSGMGLPSLGSAEVIPITNSFPAADLLPCTLNCFSREKFLKHVFCINPCLQFSSLDHSPDIRIWTQCWAVMAVEKIVIVFLLIKHRDHPCLRLGWSKFHQHDAMGIGSFPHRSFLQ
jgi:hypothetical protein